MEHPRASISSSLSTTAAKAALLFAATRPTTRGCSAATGKRLHPVQKKLRSESPKGGGVGLLLYPRGPQISPRGWRLSCSFRAIHLAATKSMSGAIEISVVARFELFCAACVCACVHVKALRGNADGSRLRGQETLPLRYTAPRLASCTEDSNISTTPPHSDHCCCCCCCWRTPAGGKSHNSRSGPPWLLATSPYLLV